MKNKYLAIIVLFYMFFSISGCSGLHVHSFVDGICSCGAIKATHYTVTFMDSNDKVIKIQTVKENESATAPEIPNLEGFDFIGWSEDFTNVTKDLVVIAKYTKHAHNYSKEVVNPTCLEQGYTIYLCSCGIIFNEDYVDSLGHDIIIDELVEPTCVNTGLTEGSHCSRCDYVVEQVEIPATGHTYEIVITNPTCLEKGYTTHTCHCGDEFVDTYVDELGHNMITDEAVEPTCVNTGLTEGSHCSRCDYKIEQEEIDALDHTYNSVVTKPTCEEQGYTTHTCHCGDEFVDTYVDALGHNMITDFFVYPTCSKPGLTEGRHCSRCNYKIEQEEIPPRSHIYEWYLTHNPTCTTDGYKEYRCSCGATRYEYYDALGHIIVNQNGISPTCTNTGLTSGEYCSRAGCTYKISQEVIPALGHDNISLITKPTCLYKGYTTHKCSRCGSTSKDSYTDALGHSLVNYSTVDPTCTKMGFTEGTACSRCAYKETRKIIPALGHDYSNNICNICDHFIVPSEGLEMVVLEDGTYGVKGIGVCTDEYIVIPANYKGKKVTRIMDSAFRSAKIKGVYIPSTVETIEEQAFCSSKIRIAYLEEGILNIGEDAFASDTPKEFINIPSTITNVGPLAFSGSIGCVVIDNEMIAKQLTVYDAVGYLLLHTNSVNVNKMIEFGNYVKYYRTYENEIKFLGNEYIAYSEQQFSSFDRYEIFGIKLVRCTWNSVIFDFESLNEDLSATDNDNVVGELYEENGKVIVRISGIGELITRNIDSKIYKYNRMTDVVVLGEGILSIPRNFCYESNIHSVVIPDSVIRIEAEAFSYSSELKTVYIGKGLEYLDERAFRGCANLVEFIVDPDNEHFISIDGVLYSKDESILICYPGGKKDQSFIIPSSVEQILPYAFEKCSYLENIYFDSLCEMNVIGTRVFAYCSNLINIEIPDSVTSIGDYAFEYCESLENIKIPNSVTSIGNYAFRHCDSLTSIVIPNSVTSVGDGAFSNCDSLTSIVIPNSVTSIGNSAFSNCDSLTSIVIPNGVTNIGQSAFYSCSRLTIYCESTSKPSGWDSNWDTNWLDYNRPVYFGVNENNFVEIDNLQYILDLENNTAIVTRYIGIEKTVEILSTITHNNIEYNVTSIGNSAFRYCDSLTSIVIPNSVGSIGNSAFSYCGSLTSIVIPNSVGSIGNSAFSYCGSLTSIVIPNSVTNIGEDAFYSCGSLTSIVIPNSVTSIGNYAFSYCTSLTSIVIPNSVTNIGEDAFCSCGSLTSIVIPNSVTSIGNSAFSYCSRLTIYCESTSKPSGWDSNWNSSNRPVYFGVNENNFVEIDNLQYILDLENNTAIVTRYIGIEKTVEILSTITHNNIEYNVTSIGNSAFRYCDSLTSIVIPNSVTSIGDYAFSSCYSLTIYCEAISEPEGWDLYWNSFECPVIWGYNG